MHPGNAQLLRLSPGMDQHKPELKMGLCQVLWAVVVVIEVIWCCFRFIL